MDSSPFGEPFLVVPADPKSIKKRHLRTYPKPRPGRQGLKLAQRVQEWDSAIATLNPEVAMKITSKVVQAIMARCPEDAIEITLDVNTRIQILDELSHLAGARKHQFAAFCRQEQCLVVWADEVESLVPSAEALEQRMITYVWSGRHQELAALEEKDDKDEKDDEAWLMEEREEDKEDEEDVGAGEGDWEKRDKRPTMLYAPLISGLAIILTSVFIGSGLRECRVWTIADGRSIDQGVSTRRFRYTSRPHRHNTVWLPPRHRTSPTVILLIQFFSICVCGNLWQTIGPVAHCHQNSSYYSGKAPERMTGTLPHITIQMPVYKEGLEGVIIPTVESLKKAITT